MLALWAVVAAAQTSPELPDINAQLYRPPVDARRTLWVETSGSITDGPRFDPRVALHYAYKPLIFLPDDGGRSTALVSDVLQADLVLPLAYDRLRLAVDLPVYLYEVGALTAGGTRLGDLAVDGRVTLFDAERSPAGLALHGRVEWPTATSASPLGSPGVVGELWVSATQELGDQVTLAANLGTRVNPRSPLENVVVDDTLVFRLGGGYRIGQGGISLDGAGQWGLSGAGDSAALPVELLAGGWIQLTRDVALRAGAGRGLTEGIGSPLFRAVSMVSVQPRPASDRDADGLVDRLDVCPDVPEDRDGWEDTDGCPDADNDGDGVLDVADRCPMVPEDLDGRRDEDGCPDPSQRIAIQVEDVNGKVLHDAVTTVSGAASGLLGSGFWMVELDEGSYEIDAIRAGHTPARVAFEIPYQGERVVVVMPPAAPMGRLSLLVADPEGRPIDVPWLIDGQPGAPLDEGSITATLPAGVHRVEVRAEGYAPYAAEVAVPVDAVIDHIVRLAASRVSVTTERIEVKGTVYFETGRADIQTQSHGLLDEVAQVLIDHPEIRKVRIEGHTDARGSDAANLDLSSRRAAAVRVYLTGRGVAAERLTSEGFGESRPVDPGTGPAAWEKNRRVDFFVEARD